MSWWSKLSLLFISVFLVFGCLSLAKADFRQAATAFTFVAMYVVMLVMDNTELGRVRGSARRVTFWLSTILTVALSVLLGLVTGMWLLASVAFASLSMVTRLVEKRWAAG